MTIDRIIEKQRPARILLVEDNTGDVILTKRAFKQARIANDLTLARTAEEALAILRKEGEYASRAKPDLILLDLNLPGMHGKELLEIIKSDGHLKRIPVIILSSSRANQDVVQSYELNASGYIIKPVNISEFEEVG